MIRRRPSAEVTADSELEWQKRWRRRIVHSELIMMHGVNVDGFLPPLDMPDKIHSAATAWSCENQAVRQLSCLPRRHPGGRALPGSAARYRQQRAGQRPGRPQTAYCAFVRTVLNTKLADMRPSTCAGRIEGFSLKKISPVAPEPLIHPKNIEADESLTLDIAQLSKAMIVGRGMRTPKLSSRCSKNIKNKDEPMSDSNETRDWNKDIMGVLRGEIYGVSHAVPTTVRIYISGTLQDFVDERRTLDTVAYPELRKYCHELGLDFQPVDVRWGERRDNDLPYNVDEITKSENVSMGPNFVVLLGDRYGEAGVVSEMSHEQFDMLSRVANEHELASRHLLATCYRRDENVVEHTYRIQYSEIASAERRHQLDALIDNATLRAVNSGRMSAEVRRHFVGSDVEREVAAYLKVSRTPGLGALCFCRKFLNTDELLAGGRDVGAFVDMAPCEKGAIKLDVGRSQQLQALKTTAEKRFGKDNTKTYEVDWLDAAERRSSARYAGYLAEFASDFVSAVKRLICRNRKQWSVGHRYYALYVEVARHARLCCAHWDRFSGRGAVLEAVRRHLQDPVRRRYPLVIDGAPGCGMSALLSACVRHTPAWLAGDDGTPCVTLVRYVGLSQQSSDVRLLLLSICLQLCAVYDVDPPPEADWDSGNRMARRLHGLLDYISRHLAAARPLVVLLDAVDRLQTADRADTFFWLPHRCPPDVHLVVTLSSRGAALQRLRNKIKVDENFVTIDALDDADAAGVVEGALARAARCLAPAQHRALLAACRRNTLPIYVQALVSGALRWTSTDDVDESALPGDAREAFVELLAQLHRRYGRRLVNAVLLYLSLLRSGLSELELRDAVACTDHVLQEIAQRDDAQANHVIALSNRLVERLLHDLDTLICQRQVDKKTLLTWTHTHHRDIFLQDCIGLPYAEIHASGKARSAYAVLAELFSNEHGIRKKVICRNKPVELDCQVVLQPSSITNIRKYTILPYLIYHGVNEHDTGPMKRQCLCNFDWMLTKLKAVSVDGVLLDFHLVKERDCEIELVRDFLLGARCALKVDPYALAAQMRGCLVRVDDDSGQHAFTNRMLEESERWLSDTGKCLLVPMFACFPSPLAPCKTRLWGLTDVLSTDNSDRLAVMKTKDGSIEVWDLDTIESVFTLPVTFDRAAPNVFACDTAVLGVVGKRMHIWDIESGLASVDMDLRDDVGSDTAIMTHFCHANNLQRVALHVSDDDFNQMIIVVDTAQSKIAHKFTDFTVKDELISRSAAFTLDGRLLVFANVKSGEANDKATVEYVYIVGYDLKSGLQRYAVYCGEKTLARLVLTGDGLCVATWTDCSLDVYHVDACHHMHHVAAPACTGELTLQECCPTEDGAVFLAKDCGADYVATGYQVLAWRAGGKSTVELFSSRLGTQEELPARLSMHEDIHIAILLAPNTATLTIWDLRTARALHTLKAHVEVVDNIVKTKNPYSIYTCSSGEGLVKFWDFYELINRKRESFANEASTESNLRRASTSRQKSAKSVRFAPDAGQLSTALDGTVRDEAAGSAAEMDGLSGETDMPTLQLDAMMQAVSIAFTADSKFVVVGSTRTLPVVWDTETAIVVRRMTDNSAGERAGACWVELACEDSIVVALIGGLRSEECHPQLYRYQAWSLETGKPLHPADNIDITITACTLNEKKEIAIATCWSEETRSELVVVSICVRSQRVVQQIHFGRAVIATELQLSDDGRYLVTNNVPEGGEPSVGTAVFPLCKPVDGSALESQLYEYRRGNKYRFYGAACSLTLANSMALSSGFNADMQVWDIATCEYENNLYHDDKVGDTKNPSLHNHRGKPINHLVLSHDKCFLVCGVQDCTATVWDMCNERLIYTYAGHNSAVCRVAISHDNQIVLTGSSDFTLCVWNRTAPNKPMCRLYIHVVPTDLQVSRDQRTIATIGACKNEPPRFMMFKLINKPRGDSNRRHNDQ